MLIVSLIHPDEFSFDLKKDGAECIELRLDLLKNISEQSLKNFQNKIDLPLIVTLKPKNLEIQIDLLKNLKPNFIDLDHSIFLFLYKKIKKAHPDAKIIVSKHSQNFYQRLSFFKKFSQADFKKLVIHENNPFKGLILARQAQKNNQILFGAGKSLQFSRLFSHWNYTYLNTPTGDGQFSFKEAVSIYRWQNPVTSFYGLIGNPIEHSPSHITHNKVLSQSSLSLCYIKFPVFSKNLKKSIDILKKLGCLGLSITTPLKESLPKTFSQGGYLRTFNTICFKKNKSQNTDVETLLDFLKKQQSKTVLILGDGACARVFKKALISQNFKCYSWSRKNGFSNIKPFIVDTIVNATSSGDPILEFPKYSSLVNLYHKEKLPPIEHKALRNKAELLTGQDFFLNQAFMQFEFWNIPVSKEVFFELVKA